MQTRHAIMALPTRNPCGMPLLLATRTSSTCTTRTRTTLQRCELALQLRDLAALGVLLRRPQLNRAAAVREVQGAHRFANVVDDGASIHKHEHLGVSSQRVLQQERKLRITVPVGMRVPKHVIVLATQPRIRTHSS